MNKDIHNVIITKTKLRNKFLKEITPMNRLAYLSSVRENENNNTTKKINK